MARVMLELGGTRWPVNCRDGEEPQVQRLGAMLDARWEQAQRAAGDGGTARVLLLIALMLADDLVETQGQLLQAQERAAQPASDDAVLISVADILEELASALEHEPTSD